jgi:hypothetical protein
VNPILQSIADDLFGYLGKTFPVCCGSDEFYYFPQIVPAQEGWTGWDDFAPETVVEAGKRLSSVESDIGRFLENGEAPDLRADAETLRRTARTLREQLCEVRFQETQPTFHLTVLCTALASSLGALDRRALGIRLKTVPTFLARAEETLTGMPRLFRDQGLAMIRDTEGWLRSLAVPESEVAPVLTAMERFGDFLRNARTRCDYLLPSGIAERIVRDHIGCGAGLDEVRDAILEEIREMDEVMGAECRTLFPGEGWREAVRKIPPPDIPEGGVLAVYRMEADSLLRHCIREGIVPEDLPEASFLQVVPMPLYLKAIRAASAYSFTPEHPSRKGTFFIVPPDGSWDANREDLVDYRMLTAHEAYPGHHLLDTWRWHFVSPVRRPVEMPLFYEGWACFAEELMRTTGYFSGPADRLLLAKRRYRRAVRGLVDLDLQTGELDLRSAADLLADAGFPRDAASSAAAKYALRPGYQVCYTFGLRRFLDLYGRYGSHGAKRFVEAVLSCGEIGFDLLERVLRMRFG